MANTKERPRARFAPIPIETTFERYRKTVPAGELTPSPSPRSPSPPPPREKRRFAPQLVESSVRRSRRAGDEGPATKPTDKTDITPYTNHIYAPRARKRFGHGEGLSSQKGHGRRESCDDEIAGGVFDLVARDAHSKLQELAMSAFPNSGQRTGGAEHFYVREGSDDDDRPRGRPLTRGPWMPLPSRRNSSEEDISWAFKEMQEHARRISRARSKDRIDTLELDRMSIDSPPSDAMGLTRTQRTSIASSPLWTSRPSSDSLGPIGEGHMPLLRAESPLPAIGESTMPYIPPESPPRRPIGESHMPYIPSAPTGRAGDMPYAPASQFLPGRPPASQIPPETGFRQPAPFISYGQERDLSLERARQQHRLRLKSSSPPLLGQDLVFRLCPSPKQTKLEPDHLWNMATGTTVEDHNRDPTEQHGLWRGYCYTTDHSEKIAPAERPAMISTPLAPPSPHQDDPFAREFAGAATSLPIAFSEEPSPMDDSSGTTPATAARGGTHSVPGPGGPGGGGGIVPEHRTKNNEPKGLHMLQNMAHLDEKLRREKAAADLEEQIAAEFDDHFVTQVFNYLSLGYPATARQYDEELSKISRIGIEELERDDEAIMQGLWGGGGDSDEEEEEEDGVEDGMDGRDGIDGEGDGGGERKKKKKKKKKRVKATGHIMLDGEAKDGVKEEDRCQRWKALKLYIYEWARQHPDLSTISPLAWGVRERRGSWGV
ncbi:2148958b-4480-4e71-a616-b61145455447 [Thermothielavioides terrestris]|uniref:2148958b-4480-4e71-a616-b61145455447 n=1 Tax=Thermothielavioides terrestris TaxID=2587410 RepID=A0A446BBT8_9PEZI|nr:2148958b-4480-4e71-a616-b61145455447 [Thermothielavioides terrestris]